MSEKAQPADSNSVIFGEGGYVPVTPLGPPPQGEPLLAQYAQSVTQASGGQTQPHMQSAPAPAPTQQANP